jgi:hypothetical protein
MNIVFDIFNISRFHVKDGNQYNFSLELHLRIGTYYTSEFQSSVKNSFKEYFDEIKKEDYSSVILSSDGNISRIKFGNNGIQLDIDMSSEKLLKIYEEVKRTNLSNKFVRIELTEDELLSCSTFDDYKDRFIYFENYSFEFVH